MRRQRGFTTPPQVAESTYGPAAFWAELRELRASIPPPREHFTWPEWRKFWDLAQRHGMMDYVPDFDGYAGRFRYGALGIGLARQFQRVKVAQDSGIDAYRFHLQEQKVIEADEHRRKAAIEIERVQAIERKTREEEARKIKPGYTTRTFTPRRPQHEESEVAI